MRLSQQRRISRRRFGTAAISAGVAVAACPSLPFGHAAFGQAAAAGFGAVVVNQAGYRPRLPKIALLLGAPDSVPTAQLIDATSGESATEIPVGRSRADARTGDPVATIDFTDFDRPGRYFLRAGKWQSYDFGIEDGVFELPMVVMLRTFYLQRCGVAVRDSISGLAHAACHMGDAVMRHGDDHHAPGDRIDARGGWHDAGDFGKYVGPTAVTLGRLLTLFEQHPRLFRDGQLRIPEGGDGVPDIVNEAAVGLDWLVSMQRGDGAFYRKVSGATWPGTITPEQDTQTRYVYGPATSDSAKAAAALALGSRIWRPFDRPRSERYRAAALKCWRYLAPIPDQVVGWRSGDESGSGKYLFSEIDDELSLTHDRDDRLWAAAELYLTTGEESFGAAFAALAGPMDYGLFEWKDPSPLGFSNYLFAESSGDRGLKDVIKGKLLRRADLVLDRVRPSGYGLAVDEFKWGSNKMVAEEGITLALAWRLTGRADYLAAAVGQLDYLLGRNHFNKSYVTGVGADPVMNMHHRPAQAVGRTLPGFLVGGPNDGAQSGVAPKGRGPLSYADDARSYATNESAIDYNASMLGLLGELAAIMPT